MGRYKKKSNTSSQISQADLSDSSISTSNTVCTVINLANKRSYEPRKSRNQAPIYNPTKVRKDALKELKTLLHNGTGSLNTGRVTKPPKYSPPPLSSQRRKIILAFLREALTAPRKYGPGNPWKFDLIRLLERGPSTSANMITSRDIDLWLTKDPKLSKMVQQLNHGISSSSANQDMVVFHSILSDMAGDKGMTPDTFQTAAANEGSSNAKETEGGQEASVPLYYATPTLLEMLEQVRAGAQPEVMPGSSLESQNQRENSPMDQQVTAESVMIVDIAGGNGSQQQQQELANRLVASTSSRPSQNAGDIPVNMLIAMARSSQALTDQFHALQEMGFGDDVKIQFYGSILDMLNRYFSTHICGPDVLQAGLLQNENRNGQL